VYGVRQRRIIIEAIATRRWQEGGDNKKSDIHASSSVEHEAVNREVERPNAQMWAASPPPCTRMEIKKQSMKREEDNTSCSRKHSTVQVVGDHPLSVSVITASCFAPSRSANKPTWHVKNNLSRTFSFIVDSLSRSVYIQGLVSRKNVASSQMDWSLALGCVGYLLLHVLRRLAYKHDCSRRIRTSFSKTHLFILLSSDRQFQSC
jgi:hypothetical protein